MIKKKILFLGGAFSQIPAIKYAKEKGYYVITVDYLPNNPGHEISDEYHNVSTTDSYKIFKLAKRLKIDAISAYASDPAALTAAYVSEELNLIGSPCKSVEILSNKNLFRKFLLNNNFNTPWFIDGINLINIENKYLGQKAIIKPNDSSGSKGVFTINNIEELRNNFQISKSFSKTGHVILEQFIERKGPQIHGEGFVIDGEIEFILLGDQVFSNVNSLIPYSTIVPSIYHSDIINDVHTLIKQAIRASGFRTGGINIEVIRDLNDKLYILEIGARNGGNFMPQLMKHASGFDLVKANIDALFHIRSSFYLNNTSKIYYAQIILHSNKDGIFQGINIPTEFINNVVEQTIYYQQGNKINQYRNSKDVVGVIIIKLNNNKELKYFQKYLQLNQWVAIL